LYRDLRDWTEKVRGMGELKTIEGVDWNLETGVIKVPNKSQQLGGICK
jgi:hypothetical protein